MDVPVAEVRLHGRRVGELQFQRGGSSFRYEADLTAPDHAVLGQSFEDEPGRRRRSRVGLPPWFANLLPEGELRRQIVASLGGGNIGDYTLLVRLGESLPGAVTVHGEAPADDPGRYDAPALDQPLRHSQAGVQLKYSVERSRLSFPASGLGGWWTVKLPDRSLQHLVANEYLTMRWLADSGFPVPPVHLERADAVGGLPDGVASPGEDLYLIERFDRLPGERVHFEDFAQVADVPPIHKYGESGATYDTLATAVRYLTGDEGYDDFIARLAAMLLTGNNDGHLKNWAFIYRDRRTAELAPVYDFHSLTVYRPYRYTGLALSLNQEKSDTAITLDDFKRLAERAGADPQRTADHVRATVHRMRSAWAGELRAEADTRFPELAKHYDQRLAGLPITED